MSEEIQYQCNSQVAQMTLEQQLAQDADDASLQRWKESMLAGAGQGGDRSRPKVEIQQVRIVFGNPAHAPISLDLSTPAAIKALEAQSCAATFYQGDTYSLEITFKVNYDMVAALQLTQDVSKMGVKISSVRMPIGTFACAKDAHVYTCKPQDVPVGALAKGNFKSKLTILDADKNTWLSAVYNFKIVKE